MKDLKYYNLELKEKLSLKNWMKFVDMNLKWFLIAGIVFSGGLLSAQDTGPVADRDTTPVVVPPPPPAKPIKKEDTTHIGNFFEEPVTPDEGIFDIYEDDDKLYFAIPQDLLNTDMLLVTRIAEIPSNLSPYLNAGSKIGEQVVQWQKKKNKILLRIRSHANTSDESDPIHLSVERNNFEPIIAAFKIETYSEDSTKILIEATSLFTDDVKALSGLRSWIRKNYKFKSIDKKRSMIESVKSYPINLEVKHIMTYNVGEPPSKSQTETLSMLMNQSFILLPKDKMKPRLYDERVGWFTVSQYDYSSEALKSDRKTYIRRWRLEPKDPEAYAKGKLVEPIKQIVYYLDPATPLKWRKYFKQGIEDWNECFESAGFKNAIVAKDPPTPEEDPEFSPEDARYSVVRYVASTTRNAVGPSVSDPRTGEILESDIIWYHNHLRSYRNRYLLETGAANPKARTLDTPEEEIGEMMRRVISHEIGHALGLPHNMKASSAYPVDSLRSGSFTQKYGIATTIMDYARYNYVAQPGDEGIRFIRQLGPYDHYSIDWGYRHIDGVDEPEDELATTRGWINAKTEDPVYMFGGRNRYDPDSQTECIGDDSMQASEYGIANLKRVTPNLINWTTKKGENYAELGELYGELLSVWKRYINHVITNVGGIHQTLKTTDQAGQVYNYVSRDDQDRALDFIANQVIETPTWLMPEEIISLLGYSGRVDAIYAFQYDALKSVLSDRRLFRLSEAEVFGADVPTVVEVIEKVSSAVFASGPDRPRRQLQRQFVELLISKTEPEAYELMKTSELPAIYRVHLRKLQTDLTQMISGSTGVMQAHYEDLKYRIDYAFDK